MSLTLIQNGRDTPLNANSGTLPDVNDAILDWFQAMTFGVVTKSTVGFQAVETQSQISFQGVWQPLTERQLQMKPEGERAWSWFWLHASPNLILQVDDVVTYLGTQYRVMSNKDFRLYGYVEYHLVQDYTGSGPAVST